jgi:hypothetical protein
MAAIVGGPQAAAAAEDVLPTLHTNEQDIEELSRRPALDIGNVGEVFRFVLGALPARVTVYPTENYYYFHFYHDGIKYAGNLRLAPDSRDRGEVSFIYFKAATAWQQDEADHYAVLGEKDGVKVEKVADLAYRVSTGDTAVTFELNDLSAVRPPEGAVEAGERFIGPVFDESGIRFFLLFDDRIKQFHYVLDETVSVNDELMRPEGLRHIVLGRRTGFAFTGDGGRKILIGVFGPNTDENNDLDGPFDQLPDNFIQGDALRDALVAANPAIAGTIDRYGNHRDQDTREPIAPYLEYYVPEDLEAADKCVGEAKGGPAYECLERIGGE